jgi:zinc transport system substrate-binding protein
MLSFKNNFSKTVLALFLILSACSTSAPSDEKVTVSTSFYPIQFLVDQVANHQVNLETLVPSGFEPHDYELTPQDVGTISTSQLLVVNGLVEPWFANVQNNLEDSEVKILNLTQSIALLNSPDAAEGLKDPHVWLSPILMSQMADLVKAKLIEVDPTHSTVYEANTLTFKEKLNQLDQEFKDGLATCEQKNFVTSHAAFGYLAQQYGLTQVPISGLSPDEEPSASELKDMVDFVRENKITTIFFESLVNPDLSQTIAHEVGAETKVLNPIEGLTDEQAAAGEDYFSLMRSNLAELRYALSCF